MIRKEMQEEMDSKIKVLEHKLEIERRGRKTTLQAQGSYYSKHGKMSI